MAMAGLEQLNLSQRRVLIRVDLNAPIDADGTVQDDTLIRAVLPTLRLVRERRAKIILLAHVGSPNGQKDLATSVIPVAERLAELLDDEIIVPDDCIGDGVRSLHVGLRDGQIMLLENLRWHRGEETSNDSFARELAALGSVYVNEAFGLMHRPDASIARVPRLLDERGLGLLAKKELDGLGRLLGGFRVPFVAALGGSCAEVKLAAVRSLVARVNALVIGGALATPFLVAQGHGVGRTEVSAGQVAAAKDVLRVARDRKVPVLLPVDHVVAAEVAEGATLEVVPADAVPADRHIVDLGPATVRAFSEAVARARTLFWNGPMGAHEHPSMRAGTAALAHAVAQVNGYSVVSGGDSLAAVAQSGVTPFISHLSTGGAAALAFVAGHELPGLAALSAREDR
jgi:phosphoglycerate kinase